MPNKKPNEKLDAANIQWDEKGQPISSRYDDIYFSCQSGIDETRYVFLENNHLPQRWRELPAQTNGCFTIGETGFGTGLNFLATVQLWRQIAPANWRLHFISVEKYPLSRLDLHKSLSLWPELTTLATELEENYPPLVSGFHRLTLYDSQVDLTLLFGEAATTLEQLKTCSHPNFCRGNGPIVDAWFLDGFAPSKNPDMWSKHLFQTIADLSNANTTFATFTSAGAVKRGLASVGFAVKKVAGFGHKRDMLRGVFGNPVKTAAQNTKHTAPWYLNLTSSSYNHSAGVQQTAIVIGGGIAGCTTANALARRGWRVSLLERHQRLAAEASGNPQGIIYPKLSKQDSTLSRFGLYGLIYASHFYRRYWRDNKYGEPCGVLVLPETKKQVAEFPAIAERFLSSPELVRFCRREELASVSNIELNAPHGLFFPNLGWVAPPAICTALVNHDNIRIIHGNAHQLIYQDNGWSVFDAKGNSLARANTVVIASGNNTAQFTQTTHLPLKPIRGQITVVPEPTVSGNKTLRTVICGAGYIAPVHNGYLTLGATYNIGDDCPDVRHQDHHANLQKIRATDAALQSFLPENTKQLSGRVGFRCTTPDYLPIVGPAPQLELMQQRFALLRKNARAHIPLPGCYYPGLYVNCGYGSRGFSYAPLAAELLATQICNEPAPLERNLVIALNPARFLIRALKRAET